MQLSDNVYIDIQIQGMGKKDFTTRESFINFRLTESAGASLPYISATLRLFDKELARCFKQNNEVLIKFGTTEADADTFKVYPEIVLPDNDVSQSGWTVEFGGFLYSKEFKVHQETEAFYGTSFDVAKKLYQRELGKPIKTNVTNVLENEVVWRRINQTACDFLLDTLLHMRLYPSFPLFAIDKYGNLIIKDFKQVCKEGPKFTLSSFSNNDYRIFNNFNITNDRDMYNMFTGYNKRTVILDQSKGTASTTFAKNDVILATTKIPEYLDVGSIVSSNEIQSSNVHNWYKETYIYNTNNQVALSSIHGEALLVGGYHKEIAPLDLVDVVTSQGKKGEIDGLYLVETVTTEVRFDTGMVFTTLELTRDNINYIENYVKEGRRFSIQSKFMQEICASVHDLRVAYAFGKQFIDGTYMSKLLSFGVETKRNLLRIFSIAGVALDFNSCSTLVSSLLLTANSLMNTLVSMIFPEDIAAVFRDYLIRKPSLKALLTNYISLYVPSELVSLINNLINSLDGTASSLNSIAKDNGITVTVPAVQAVTESDKKVEIEDSTVDNSQQKVVNIIDNFKENTSGVDIPFPLVTLTESQAILPESALRNLLASETIANLTNLGYMEGIDSDEMRKVLLGEEDLSFNLINKLNKNAGNSYNYRFWGTYSDLIELTSFKVKNSYKDKYRTIPCTKLINATQGAKIFFACPKAEDDLKFYINSTRAEVGKAINTFDIDLGYTDSAGNIIIYTVYYTESGYNSTSVMFEVKQGGMV